MEFLSSLLYYYYRLSFSKAFISLRVKNICTGTHDKVQTKQTKQPGHTQAEFRLQQLLAGDGDCTQCCSALSRRAQTQIMSATFIILQEAANLTKAHKVLLKAANLTGFSGTAVKPTGFKFKCHCVNP